MKTYRIEYSRRDMPSRCVAYKTAQTEKEALDLLKTLSKKCKVEFTDIHAEEANNRTTQ